MQSATDFAAARRAMIDSQLRTSGVNEPWVLSRMVAVPREDFVPAAMRTVAYMDRAQPLASGAGMLAAPLFYARLLAEAKPAPGDRVLVVDGGSGYLPRLLEGLAATVDTIAAKEAAGSRKKGDYNLLLVDGAAEELPPALAGRLADDARVVTGSVTNGVTRLAIGRKAGGAIALLPLAEMGIPRLPAFDKPKVWSF